MPIHDLTRQLRPGIPTYPDDPEFELHRFAEVEADGYQATEIWMSSHTGTHVDAPAHTESGGRPIDAYPPEAFHFDALLVDVTGKGPREAITRTDLQQALSRVAPEDAFTADMVVLRTGWADNWETGWYDDHPYLTGDAAAWLADNDYHVGIDALSVDPTPTANSRPDEPDGVPAHHALLGDGKFIVENLCNLGALPDWFRLEAYPLPVKGGDGAPARVIARA